MKLVGFLKKYDPKIAEAEILEENTPFANKDIYDKVISYLKNGYALLDFMEFIYDDDGNKIAPLSILTDGYWIWPSYFYYYLKQYPNNDTYKAFLADIERNEFLSKEEIKKNQNQLIDFYLEKTGTIKKEPKSTSLVKQMRPKIKKSLK
jgi:hypothetical protein